MTRLTVTARDLCVTTMNAHDQDKGAAARTGGRTAPRAPDPRAARYVSKWTLKDGTPVTIRPICPADEPAMIRFHKALSDDSVYFRYLGPMKLSQRIAHQRLLRVCWNHYGHELALVAVSHPPGGGDEILGVGRLIEFEESHESEFALLIADGHQHSGLGTHLLRLLIKIGRDEGLVRIIGYILPENRAMLHVCDELGFRRVHPAGDPVVRVELDLAVSRPAAAKE